VYLVGLVMENYPLIQSIFHLLKTKNLALGYPHLGLGPISKIISHLLQPIDKETVILLYGGK